VTNYATLTGIHDGTRAIIPTNDGGGSSTDIIRRRASSNTQDKSPQFEHRVGERVFGNYIYILSLSNLVSTHQLYLAGRIS
jgi:hypothetical protein